MKKKAAAKKIRGSDAKKEIVRKIKEALRSSEKKVVDKKKIKPILSKKKQVKQVKAAGKTKTNAGARDKVKAKAEGKVKTKTKIKIKTKVRIKTETKAKVKAEKTKSEKKEIRVIKKVLRKPAGKAEGIAGEAAVKRKTKILSATVKKAAPEKKTVGALKAAKKPDAAEKLRKPEKTVKAGVKVKPVLTGKITKTSGKTRRGAKKEVPANKIGKIADKKIAPEAEKKSEAGLRQGKEAKPGRKKVKTSEVLKKAAAIKVLGIKQPAKTGKSEQVRAGVAAGAEKRGRPAESRQYPSMPPETLPSHYDENGITIIVVNPCKIFTFWEVTEDTLNMLGGELAIRLYDVSGADVEGMDANDFLDILLNDRIGSLYIDVIPDRDYISDIGVLFSGVFIAIARSNKVRTPHAAAEEALWPTALDDTGIRQGY